MSCGHPGVNKRLPRDMVNLQDHCPTTSAIMDMKARNISATPPPHHLPSTTAIAAARGEKMKAMDYNNLRRTRSQGSGRRLLAASYFSLESMLLLVCLTASLLVLPLILPPLPPPPFMLLLLPIGILVVLLTLAFMPFNARDLTYTYV